jgi:hypothetical protein
MKKHVLAIILILLCGIVYAAGKAEEEKKDEINNNWILCITALDSSALPESKRAVTAIFIRGLTDKIRTINYRVRVSHEYAYYEDYAWSRALATAAKSLESKYNERSLLLYQGSPDWKYRRDLKKKDEEIAVLRESLEKKQAERPLVNRMPEFDLSADSKTGSYPAAPRSGGEYQFCQNQNADAFLSGTISEFYGRYFVTLKLYAKYTRSWIYEDDVLFSADDIDGAVNDIAARLLLALAGNRPAALAVSAEPPETLVLINHGFAGRGNVEAEEFPPGKVSVSFSLDDYTSEFIETDLAPDELTEIAVSLSPIVKGEADIITPEKSEVSVYHGALYVGEAPFSLWLPINQLDYVNILTPRGEEFRAVFYTPEHTDMGITVSLAPKLFPYAGEQRVNKARSRYYWAWGGTWLVGITAWITTGMSTEYEKAYAASNKNPDLERDMQIMYTVSISALVLTGLAVLYDFFETYRYVNAATEYAVPIVKTEITR